MSQSRREFLSGLTVTSLAGLTSARPIWSAEEDVIPDEPGQPSEKDYGVRVGVIGLRGRGIDHLDNFGLHVTAVCDVDQQVLEQQAAFATERSGHAVDRFTDYRRMLDETDLDAVGIATPNHTHALIAIAACAAGKHVYLEKPVSHNVWEGRQMVRAARLHDCLVATGTQCRSSSGIRAAVEFVRSGELGAIKYAVGTCYKARQSIGKLDRPLEIPDHVDYDLWCGPAAKVELYRPQLHYDWHWDFNTGNGDMGNQGVHQMDIARWFLGETQLSPRVISIGGRLGYEDAGNTPNTQVVLHDYPDAPLIFETRGLPTSKVMQELWTSAEMDVYRGSRVGVIVQCERGHVLIPNYHLAVAFDDQGTEIQRWQGGGNHFHNFLDAVAAGDHAKLAAGIEDGHVSSALCHTGTISHQLGQPLSTDEIRDRLESHELLADSFERMSDHLQRNEIDSDLTCGPWLTMNPATERFVDNDAANARLTREYRQPFVVEEIAEPTLVS